MMALLSRYQRGPALAGHAQQCKPRARSLPVYAESSNSRHVIVLDFDGVVVDSEGEVSHSALSAARQRWPDIMQRLSQNDTDKLMQGMRLVRPVLVRGYESMVMARMLAEDGSPQQMNRMLQDWANVLPQQLAAWGEQEAELAPFFEKLRNTWMTNHPEEWLSRQRPYPDVIDTLHACPFPLYLATSKAGHRVAQLLNALGYPMTANDPCMFASLLPPEPAKAAALHTITLKHTTETMEGPATALQPATVHASTASSAQHSVQPAVQQVTVTGHTSSGRSTHKDGTSQLQQSQLPIVHFVDDRLDTLLAAAAEPHLAHVRLYMASWGYCTPAELQEAHHTARVNVIDLQQFHHLLRHGHVPSNDGEAQN